MNSALIYLSKTTFKNQIKKLMKSPLKFIGTVLVGIYFLLLPFTMRGLLIEWNLNNATGFTLLASVLVLYLIMPSTLSYFKRKGIVFETQDVNFTFTSPISPKAAVLYAISKQAIITVLFQLSFLIAAVLIFQIPIVNAIAYTLVDIVFSSMIGYSLAVIMYSSETITLSQKKLAKYAIWFILALVTVFVAVKVIQTGFQLTVVRALVSHPVILLIPFFGWQLGWLNLIILGPSLVNVIASVLFILSGLGLSLYALKMPCTGEYYEEALSFSIEFAAMKEAKGDVTLSEAFGKKTKVKNRNGELKGQFAQTIFYRQVLERKRAKRFFILFTDFVLLLASLALGIGYRFLDFELPIEAFFPFTVGFTVYMVMFFNPKATWRKEFDQYTLYLMPDSPARKLFYATLLEHVFSLVRSIFISVPLGVLYGATFFDILFAILAQVAVRMICAHITILVREIGGMKLGQIVAPLLNFMVNFFAMVVVGLAVFTYFYSSSFVSFSIIAVYAAILIPILVNLSGKALTNIESLRD